MNATRSPYQFDTARIARYRKSTTESLRAALVDVRATLVVARTWADGGRGEGKYTDEACAIVGELKRRGVPA